MSLNNRKGFFLMGFIAGLHYPPVICCIAVENGPFIKNGDFP